MKKKILLFTVCAGLGVVGLSSYHGGAGANGYDCTGAESSGTGSYVNRTGCSYGGGCHSTAATSTISVAIELDSAGIATTHYRGGMAYTVKITGTETGGTFSGYGFQLTALKGTASAASNADAGTWATTGLPASTRCTPPGSYTQLTIMEQSATNTLSGTSFTKSFAWTAPATGTGTISFWSVVNFVNGNSSADAGDKWNTDSVKIQEWPPLSVSVLNNTMGVHVFPNPVVNTMNISFEGVANGTYAMNVYDLSGRVITTQPAEINGNATVSVDANYWKSGAYYVIIDNGFEHKSVTVVKQ